MLILTKEEAERILIHLYAIKLHYQNQSELFKGYKPSLVFYKYMKEVKELIAEMEAELGYDESET